MEIGNPKAYYRLKMSFSESLVTNDSSGFGHRDPAASWKFHVTVGRNEHPNGRLWTFYHMTTP